MMIFYSAKMRKGSYKVRFGASTMEELKSNISKLVNMGFELVEIKTV